MGEKIEKQKYFSLIEKIKRKCFNLEDNVFELVNGFDFSGIIKNENLVVDNKYSLKHSTAYQAVWCRNLREIFDEANKTNYLFKNFIDIGSGKGKACFYANKKCNFELIVGIEFSKPLVDIANRNNKKINSKKVIFINADASTYRLPNESNLIFLFNPFSEVILERFITNNKKALEDNDSVIAYANDVHRILLTKFGFETIYRNQTRKISLYRIS
jgi:SAM-dependent methyltransferase